MHHSERGSHIDQAMQPVPGDKTHLALHVTK